MHRLLVLVIASGAVVVAAPAHAGPFGGFSADQSRYLSGQDRICAPVPVADGKSRAAPHCEQADAGRVAASKFRRGRAQQGAQATYDASFRGTDITIARRPDGQAVVVWTAIDPIARITGVYVSEGGKLVAVEYQSRFGGRMRTDTVAFVLPGAPAVAAPEPAAGAPEPAAAGAERGRAEPPGVGPADPADPRIGELLDRARRADRKGGAGAAADAYRKVLVIAPDHPEARYGLARSLVRQGKRDAAVDELRALADAGHADAIVWLVEARFDKAFARLRAHAGFRAATGLAPDPARPRTRYERLVGFSSTWEQPEVKCEQAQVALHLARLERTFDLRITSRCRGYEDETRLSGRWRLGTADRVELVFPNPESAEEILTCQLDACTAGEDCLRCGEDADLAFTLRPVRR